MKKVKVMLSKKIVDKIKKRIEETEFKSVEEYIEFVLKEVLKDEEVPKVEEEKIKERLKALGYF